MNHEHALQRGKLALLFMQMFSTLGFSVLYSTLILYETQGLHLSDLFSTALTGSFIAFNYALHVLGGYMGGRFLSYRGLFISGMLLQAVGCTIISIPNETSLVLGSAITLSGCGLNMISINCMLTQLFDPHDKRRESAFLWNYSSMNLGYFIGFSISGYFQLHQNYHTLFIFSAFGSLISFFLTIFSWKYLKDKGTIYADLTSKKRTKSSFVAAGIIIVLIVALIWLLRHPNISNALILLVGVIVISSMCYLSSRQPSSESVKKMWAFVILSLSSLIFWTLYQMAPMGLTLFYTRNVDQLLLGITIPPQWLQNINTVLIVLGGPTLASLNHKLRKKGYKISLPFQFTTSLFLIGTGFLLLPLGIHFSDVHGISNIQWIMGCYVLQSIGELFISPIGYAMVGQLVPIKLQGFSMGAWMMISGVAAVLSNYFSQMALGTSTLTDPLATNPTYAKVFVILGILSILMSILVFCIKSILHRLIQERSI